MLETTHTPALDRSTGVFDRVVVGVDGSQCARVAAAQADVLRAGEGRLHLVGVVEPVTATPYAFGVPLLVQDAQQRIEHALADERDRYRGATTVLGFGSPTDVLLDAADQRRATLVAVGAHGTSRAAGILLGSAVTGLLHRAPCSVLVARATSAPAEFPRSIFVGTDGSAGGRAAVEVAKELAGRFDAWLRILVATGGDPVDVDALAQEPRLEWSNLPPLDALRRAARSFDLLVVGSRGLRGLHALGSVSERIGHESPSSVLVVRTPLPAGEPRT